MRVVRIISVLICLLFFLSVPGYAAPDYTRTPVFFVHGHGDNADIWDTMIADLIASGYPSEFFEAIQLIPDNGANIPAAEDQIAPAIEDFLDSINTFLATNYPDIPLKTKVDLVSHSMGSMSARWYAARIRPDRVHKWISLAGANHGTDFACSLPGPGAADMCPAYATTEQESFIQFNLNGAPLVADVDETPYGIGDDSSGVTVLPPDQARRILYVTIRTSPDPLIQPEDSVVLDGSGGVEIPIPDDLPATMTSEGNLLMTNGVGHDPMLSDPDTMRLIANILGLADDGLPQGEIFFDDFSRANGDDLGNDWIEKNPQAFALIDGAAVKQAVSTGYQDNISHRPASEDLLDVEASVEFRLFSIPPGYPQLFIRVQSDTVEDPKTLDGYILSVVDDASRAVLARQRGSSFETTLADLDIVPPLNTTDSFRLRLRAIGTDIVELTADVEHFDGTSWQVIGQANFSDDSPERIDTAGSVGFGGYLEANYAYDNFVMNTPVAPSISIDDVTVTEGDAGTVDAVFTVSLSAPSGLDVSVDYDTADGTAVAASDYEAASDTLFFPAGSTSQTILVAVNGDIVDEPNETFFVNLPNAINATIADVQGSAAIIDDDEPLPPPVAAYSFDEGSGDTVFDASGKGNEGMISGASWTTQGRFGNALSFDGIDDWVTILDDISLDLTTGMTLEAWVYPTSILSGWSVAILKERPGGSVYYLAPNSLSSQSATGVFIGSEQILFGGTALPVDTWTHLAATRDGTTKRLYVNGVEVASRAQIGEIQVSDGPLRIGGNSIYGEYFPGIIDEVRIYDRALTASELQADMTTPVTPSISIDNVHVTEGDAGTVDAVFTVSLSAPSGLDVTVDYDTADGTAVDTSDYEAASDTLFFPAGSTSQTIPMAVNGDLVDEPDETFFVNLSNAINATISDSQGNAAIIDDDDPVAAYNFDEGSGETVFDASGNGNNGSIFGASWTSQGRFGNGLVFDGIDDWVTINDATSLDLTTEMTLEAWVYPTVPLSGWRVAILKERPGGSAYYLAPNSTSNQPATGIFIGGEQILLGGTALPVNTWTHLAATYDGTTNRLYINGIEVASRAQTGDIQVSAGPLRIGGNSIYGEYFPGRIDEVRIYDRALTASEILTDMITPVGP